MNSNYNIFFIYENLREIVDLIEDQIKVEVSERFDNINIAFFKNSFRILHNEITEDIKGNSIAIYFGSKRSLVSKKCLS